MKWPVNGINQWKFENSVIYEIMKNEKGKKLIRKRRYDCTLPLCTHEPTHFFRYFFIHKKRMTYHLHH